jgi:mRNA interferase YafQ
MASKPKPAAEKRTRLPLASDFTKTFVKDWLRLSATARYDMTRLKQAMMLLIANDAPLGAEWRDHQLTGKLADCRECHIGGDFLLVYQTNRASITFVRAGTHAELFE